VVGTTAALAGCYRLQARTDGGLDAIVVGGGLAGLSAATAFERAGLQCQLIEAQPQLGGRVSTEVVRGVVVGERGAQFVNEDMTRIRGLMAEHGVATTTLAATRRQFRVSAQGVTPLEQTSALHQLTPERVEAAFQGAADVPMSGVLRGLEGNRAADLREFMAELAGRPPSELSLRAAMNVVASYDSAREAEEMAAVGGLSRVVDGLVRALRRPPVVDAPVTVVRWSPGAVEVVAAGQRLRTNRLVVAVPPPIAARIRFEPALPQPLRVALSAYRTGRMVKTVLRFEAPFWRRGGVATDFLVHSPTGAVLMDMATDEAARLVVFAGADAAIELAGLQTEKRAARILDLVSTASGTRAPRPLETVQGVWVDHPWCGGGYNSWVAFGEPVDSPAVLRAGTGPLCFAGAELATRFAGYMEGALHSGEAAAQLLLRRT